MAMFIKRVLPSASGGVISRTASWRVGDRSPLALEEVSTVTEVYADSTEFDYIVKNCQNLPVFRNLVYGRWFGDHAKFIAGGL